MNPVFLAGLVLAGRRSVLFGGDAEADAKCEALVDANADVTVVTESAGPVITAMAASSRITWRREKPSIAHADGAFLVMSTIRDEDWSAALFARATARDGFLLCCLDQPAYCTFTNVATVRRGTMRIGIGSDGNAPLLARRMREALSSAMDDAFVAFADRLAALRARTDPARRREVVTEAMRGFAMDVRFTLPPQDSD